MGGSLCLRMMPQVRVKSVLWLLPFLARCTKTKPNQKLEPRPLDKERPVSWRHGTSGGLMLLLSNAWPGDTVILCLISLQGESWHLKGTKKLLHVMPRHPLLFHWKWEHVNSTDMGSCSHADAQPPSLNAKSLCQDTWHLTAPFIFYFCSAQKSIKFWIEVSVKVEGQSEKLHSHCLGLVH